MTYIIEPSRFDPPNFIVRAEPSSRAWRLAKHIALRYSPRESAHVVAPYSASAFQRLYRLGYDVGKNRVPVIDPQAARQEAEREELNVAAGKVMEVEHVVAILTEIEASLKGATSPAEVQKLREKVHAHIVKVRA